MKKRNTPQGNANLIRYSSFYSSRRPANTSQPVAKQPKPRGTLSKIYVGFSLFAVVVMAVYFFRVLRPSNYGQTANHSTTNFVTVTDPGVCAGNKLSALIVVSISQRHLWACNLSAELYNSAVVTGYNKDPAETTPIGTYKIYAKQTNITLTGSDDRGSWSDPVSYWLSFLYNNYGQYGFHDATWRPSSDFGNVSPNSPNASRGCVELPTATAKWLYNWAPVGTTVTIKS